MIENINVAYGFKIPSQIDLIDKINELVDVVNKLEQHTHNSHYVNGDTNYGVETSTPIFSELVDLKGTMKEQANVNITTSNGTTPIVNKTSESCEYGKDFGFPMCDWTTVETKHYEELLAVIKECYELSNDGYMLSRGANYYTIAEKLKGYVDKK